MNNKIKNVFNLTDAEYLSIDETEFRARFRERIHHTLEIQVYAAIAGASKIAPKQTETAKLLIKLWNERGISLQMPEYAYALALVKYAEDLSEGKEVDLSSFKPMPLTNNEKEMVLKVIHDRRSVRHFSNNRISDDVINTILDAGLWAAHSCNLQSVRYLIVREENEPGLFQGSDVPGGPVHLVVLQDERVYRANPLNPIRNRLIDAGAAAQNIVIAAQALGVSSVWLTFNEQMIDRIRSRFDLPDYISIVTYVDIGYSDQTPCPPFRIQLNEAIKARL